MRNDLFKVKKDLINWALKRLLDLNIKKINNCEYEISFCNFK